jgi:hypothetical protein
MVVYKSSCPFQFYKTPYDTLSRKVNWILNWIKKIGNPKFSNFMQEIFSK